MAQARKSKVKEKAVHGNEGFTLIELLIAITILVVIIAIMVSLFSTSTGTASARAEKLIDHGRQISQAVQLYNSKHNEYPTDLGQLLSDGDLNSLPSDWKVNDTDFAIFDNTSSTDETIEFTGTVGTDVCKQIIDRGNYYTQVTSGSTTLGSGMYVVVDSSNAPITSSSDCDKANAFVYLVSADIKAASSK